MRPPRLTAGRLALLLAATVVVGAGVAYAASLPVGSARLWAGTQTLTKGTCTLTGTTQTTDTYVDASKPTSSFGTTATMLVQPDAPTRKISLVQFAVGGCNIPTTGGADSATLSLFVTAPPKTSRTLTVLPVSSSWGNTLTWNGAQSLTVGSATTTFATGTTKNVTVSIPVTVDLDALIKSPGSSFGWEIVDNGANASGDTTTFATSASGTASQRPTLTIGYEQ